LLELDTIVAHLAEAAAASDAIEPVVVRFLLAEYAASGSDTLSAVVGHALALALDQHEAAPAAQRPEWLLLFANAAVWSDDDRVRDAAASLLAGVDMRDATAIDAVLQAAMTIDDRARLSTAVDHLERLIGRGYEPGDGVAAADQFAVAAALLTAFDITGRLPYAMLAEELVQTAQRRRETHDGVESACRAAHVLSRLAALYADEDYRRAAIVAATADYRRDSELLLDAYAPRALETPRDAACYGLALAQWLGLH
jgi:hypothetical protein